MPFDLTPATQVSVTLTPSATLGGVRVTVAPPSTVVSLQLTPAAAAAVKVASASSPIALTLVPALRGATGPQGPAALSETGGVLTWNGNKVTMVEYPESGNFKQLFYDGDRLTRVDYVFVDETVRTDLVYGPDGKIVGKNKTVV